MTALFKKWRKTNSLCGWILDIPRVLHFFSASACLELSTCVPFFPVWFPCSLLIYVVFYSFMTWFVWPSSGCILTVESFKGAVSFCVASSICCVCSASTFSGYEGNLISLCCSEIQLKSSSPLFAAWSLLWFFSSLPSLYFCSDKYSEAFVSVPLATKAAYFFILWQCKLFNAFYIVTVLCIFSARLKVAAAMMLTSCWCNVRFIHFFEGDFIALPQYSASLCEAQSHAWLLHRSCLIAV